MTCPGPEVTGLGAYVLGALDPEEGRRVEEHVGTCPACAAELTEFRSLPALLDLVRREDLQPVSVTPSPDLFARMSAAADGGRARARRSRTMALVAAVVIAVLGLGVGVTVWVTGPWEESATASAGPVQATVTASTAEEGIALDVAVAGLDPGETCRMLVVDRDGGWHAAGEWPASKAGDGQWKGWAEIPHEALTEVVLVGDGGRELIRLPF
jgi:anti-sigma factor RsiW